jgi:hypothetical protein
MSSRPSWKGRSVFVRDPRVQWYDTSSGSSHLGQIRVSALGELTEIAGLEFGGPKIINGWNLEDSNLMDRVSGVEFAGLELDGPTVRGGICRTGIRWTYCQGWNLQDWNKTDVVTEAEFTGQLLACETKNTSEGRQAAFSGIVPYSFNIYQP